MTQLFAGSIRTHLQAEEESGQSVSFHQTDGHVDPVGATNALVKAVCNLGASAERHCPVNALQRENDHWLLDTSNGVVRASHVVVATSFVAERHPLINTPYSAIPFLTITSEAL